VSGPIFSSSAIDDLRTAGRVVVDRIIKIPAIIMHAEGTMYESFCLQVDFVITIRFRRILPNLPNKIDLNKLFITIT
jgi:hypothetical protein